MRSQPVLLGLGLAEAVPNARTMWIFREELKEKRLMGRLFARFDECLRELDVEMWSGQIIDARWTKKNTARSMATRIMLMLIGAPS